MGDRKSWLVGNTRTTSSCASPIIVMLLAWTLALPSTANASVSAVLLPTPAPPTSAEYDALRARLDALERRLQLAEVRAATTPPIVNEARHSPFLIELKGYADVQFAYFNYGLNQNRTNGSQSDSRLAFDTTRFALSLEGSAPFGITFEAEIEFEHGGAGVAMDLEYEEYGEFDIEVGKGGEVKVEELKISKSFLNHFVVSLGRFYVAFGILNRGYKPTDYLASVRSEAETAVLPDTWDELGIQVKGSWKYVSATLQLINGLDSSGFSSQHWIRGGHQGAFELVRGTDPAGVARIDFIPRVGSEVGLSTYFGGTTRNRPKPDLTNACPSTENDVAPCGYVDALLLLIDAHARFQVGPIRGTALLAWGSLSNAQAVSERNARLSNLLNVLRSTVSDSALLAWAEVGLNVFYWHPRFAAHRLEPFFRFDYYDTIFKPRSGIFDNPRFERFVYTAGVAYTFANALTLKLDAAHRRFGSSTFNPETTVRLAVGFVY